MRTVYNFLHHLRSWSIGLNIGANIPTQYAVSAPSPQNALDIFKGQWWSRLPGSLANLQAGDAGMFEDPRLAWALTQFGAVSGESVLELGPLEGGHSYMLECAGAKSVTAIEANPRAYLKCLIVKELLGLTRTRFLFGDFVEYLRNEPPQFFAVFASGVLYHMIEPAELIALLSEVTDRIYLWTHYYDGDLVRGNRTLIRRFTAEYQKEYMGFRYRIYRYQYWGSFGRDRFCGGPCLYAHWMRREDILACLRHYGFNVIQTDFEATDHPGGPAFALVARRPAR